MTTTTVEENPTDSNLVAHAIRELDLIGETSLEPPSMRAAVLELVRVFAAQGHSGSSAAWAVAVVEKLLRFEPLTPLTDDPTEWQLITDRELHPVSGERCSMWQSRREPAAFAYGDLSEYRHLSSTTWTATVPKKG